MVLARPIAHPFATKTLPIPYLSRLPLPFGERLGPASPKALEGGGFAGGAAAAADGATK